MSELEGEAIPQRLDIDVVRSTTAPVQVRADDDDEGAPLGSLVGEFTVFDSWYEINSMWEGHFIERTRKGAGKRTINNRSDQTPVRVLLEHGFDPTVGDKPLGVPRVLEERDSGIYAETPLLDTSYNRDLAPALRSGAYGQSFRFRVVADEWNEPDSEGWEDTGDARWADLPQRTITEFRLEEFGPTVWPASPATNSTTGLRSATDQFYEQLQRRDSGRYEAAIRSVRGLRAPVAAPAVEPEDSQERHSEDPAPGHSEDSSITHSEETTTTPIRKDTVMETMTIEEREARMTEIDATLAEIDKNNAGAELRSADQEAWDTLSNERAEHKAAVDAQRKRQDYLRSLGADEGSHENGGTTEKRAAAQASAAPAVHRKPENIYDTAAIRGRASSLDEARKMYRDNAKRAIDAASYHGVDRSDAQHQVADLLDKLDEDNSALALRILNTGSPTYDRAFGKAVLQGGTQGLSPEEHRALSLGTATEGGYAVPFQLDPTIILTSAGSINPLRGISRNVQITGKVWQGLTSAGITVTRSAEAAEAGDNSPALAQPEVSTSRVDGFVPFSYELEYTWAQLRQEITMLLNDAKDTEEATSFTTGTGVGVNPEGVLTGSTVAVLTASATALTRADLYKVKNALPPRFRARAQWLAETSFYDAVRDLSVDSDIWAELAGDINPRLLNKPTNEASAMPVFAAVADNKDAIFGDFGQFVIVDRVGMNVELIPQVFGANQRPTGQRGIYATWFNGSKVLVPGAFRVLTQDDGI